MNLKRLLKYVKDASDEHVMLDVKIMLEDKNVKDMFIFDAVKEINAILQTQFIKVDIGAIMYKFLKHERKRHRIASSTIREISKIYGYECWYCLVESCEVCDHKP